MNTLVAVLPLAAKDPSPQDVKLQSDNNKTGP